MRTAIAPSNSQEEIIFVDLTTTSSSDYGINDSADGLGVNSVGAAEEEAQLVSPANADIQYQPSSSHCEAAPLVELPHLLNDLRALAIDPLQSSCPSLVQKAFMKYRSLAYQKSVYLAERNKARRPTRLLATAEAGMPTVVEPVNAGVHRQPSSIHHEETPSVELPRLLHDLRTLAIDPLHGSCPSSVQQVFMKYRSLVFRKKTCERRKVDLPILLNDLRTLAIDPLHGTLQSVQNAILKYRSMVYRKSVFKAELNARRPTATATADDEMSTVSGRKDDLTDRSEHIERKRQRIGGSDVNDAEESESDSSFQASNVVVGESSLPIYMTPTSAAEQQVPGTSNELQNMSNGHDIIEEARRLRKMASEIMDNVNRRLREYEPFNL